jgi:phosphatidylinositol glycan class S
MTIKPGDQESPKASASQVDQPSVQRAPPPETPAALQTRFRVIAAFWAVIIFLGFPIWWKTTSIYRASLPIEEMVDWADGKVRLAKSPLGLVT